MITLFHAQHSRSLRVRWLLEELGLPYEIARITFTPDSLKGPEYLKVHPLGKVPSIRDGDVQMFESGAIVEWLLEKYANGRLAPPPATPARAAYLQWFHFAEGTAMPPVGQIVQHSMLLPEAERIPAVIPPAAARVGEWLDVVEAELAGRQWICGAEFTAADVMLGYSVYLAKLIGLVGERPNVSAYHERCTARTAFARANAD